VQPFFQRQDATAQAAAFPLPGNPPPLHTLEAASDLATDTATIVVPTAHVQFLVIVVVVVLRVTRIRVFVYIVVVFRRFLVVVVSASATTVRELMPTGGARGTREPVRPSVSGAAIVVGDG